MNIPQGYTYSFVQPANYGWVHPYFQQNLQYFNYFNNPMLTQPPFNYFFSFKQNNISRTQAQVVKVQEDSLYNRSSLKPNYELYNKNGMKKITKKKIQAKNVQQENIYDHPPKIVHHKVKYFDPCAAPIVTNADYNLIENVQKELKLHKSRKATNNNKLNQLQYAQQYTDPFLTFKYRRVKKKFKKYLKNKDERHLLHSGEDLDSENDSDNSSSNQYQESESVKNCNSYSLEGNKKKQKIKNKKAKYSNSYKKDQEKASQNQNNS